MRKGCLREREAPERISMCKPTIVWLDGGWIWLDGLALGPKGVPHAP
jgi:hypothetical protein